MPARAVVASHQAAPEFLKVDSPHSQNHTGLYGRRGRLLRDSRS
ncbi:hypothetical protein APASM_5221 [Actinosynnema pretiosum subsp. pretiosum]|nr:hypothetical protein APASM_5221 [Actinosynnema pretiosum subsp. pretiosum]